MELTPCMSRLRSRIVSNVSEGCPQELHVTRERSRPPKSLWTQVVSAILVSSFLVESEAQF